MYSRPHIVRIVADEARRQFFRRRLRRADLPQPRVQDDEIGVEFDDGDFIPYADLGFNSDVGFYRLSETEGVKNETAPYAAGGRLIDPGHLIVTAAASGFLTNDEIRELIDRHASGDYGEHGEFYDLDVDDGMLLDEPDEPPGPGETNKVNTLTGLEAIASAYTVREHRIWVITEAGDQRTTVILLAGAAQE